MNNTNNALETLVQRDKQIKKTNDKLKASINELDAELETTTNALSNHASNTEIHTSKEELIQFIVDHLESLDLGITKEVVSVLPTENISDNTLYFVPNDKGSRDEYFYINDKWELIGSTETNLSDYYTKQETNTLLDSKANSVHNHVVSDITDFPTIPTKLSQLENDMGFGSGSGGVITSISWANITDKPNFATVATSGSYNDLSNKPTIPNVYNKTLTIQKNGTNVATFTSNSNTDVTADITVPTKVSELSNDSGFITGISWDKVTNKPTLATVATSGSYTDLSNTPTIPTKVSQLENDTGFINTLTNVVDTKSNQTIGGTKKFTADIVRKYTSVDITTTPTSDMYAHINFTDKNDKSVAYIQYAQKSNGVDYIGLRVRDKNSNTWGVQLNTNKEFVPLGNNSYSLGSANYKWSKIYSDDVVHTSGNETINGTKTFSNTTISNKELQYKDIKNDWTDKSLNVWCDAGHVEWFDKTGTRRMHELVGANGGVWRKVCYINEIQYFSVDSNRNISFSGTTTFNGNLNANKFIGNLQGNADTSTKASYLDNYSLPGGNKIYLDWSQQVKGYVGLKVDNTVMGGLITTKNIGSQAANSATYATTQATTDNSTKIATTAWVRTYVNSVVGSSAVGSSISAYYSKDAIVTAIGTDTSNTDVYPADYSNYIDISPKVGTIYTGSQLFSSVTPTASGTIKKDYLSSGKPIYYTTAKATATFSGAFSSSAKYLCTSANAVKFRVYVDLGTSSSMGAASIIDQSISKSIFIRVE